jgi:hypothetical protein
MGPRRLHPEVVAHGPLEEDGRLEDERGAAPELECVERRDVATVKTDATACRLLESIEAAEEGRFSRARWTDQREGRAAADLE